MEIKEMTIDELQARKAAIATEVDAEGADLDALENEARSINAEIEARKEAEAAKVEIRELVANGTGEVITTEFNTEERKTMTNAEVRASKEYIDAFAEYLKTGKDAECRSLLTENVNGPVPVPSIVDETIKTTWERDEITSRVRKTSIRGNLKSYFELSATGAVEHTEGAVAPAEEVITFGVVNMIPKNIKKWITVSDEVVAMGGEAFIRYIYDELTYQIIKKLAELIVADIIALPAAATATSVSADQITGAPSVTLVGEALAHLANEATDPVVIMNRLTEAEFLQAQAAGNFAIDPFYGLTRVYTSALPAYSAASSGAVYAVVGDLKGAQVNYPEGEGVVIKWDDLSLAETDMVKVVGREYAAHAVTADKRFCNILKA